MAPEKNDRIYHTLADLALAAAAQQAVELDAALGSARADLDATRELLSVALERIVTLTTRCVRQTAHLRRLMGLPVEDDGWHPPIRLEDVPAGDIPDGLVRAREIRWRAFDVDETR
jgi:hypothetical protein